MKWINMKFLLKIKMKTLLINSPPVDPESEKEDIVENVDFNEVIPNEIFVDQEWVSSLPNPFEIEISNDDHQNSLSYHPKRLANNKTKVSNLQSNLNCNEISSDTKQNMIDQEEKKEKRLEPTPENQRINQNCNQEK